MRRQLNEENSFQNEKIIDIKSEDMDNEAIFKEVKKLLHNQNMNKSKLDSLMQICLKILSFRSYYASET